MSRRATANVLSWTLAAWIVAVVAALLLITA
jgi:hypothetical protein